MTIGLIGYGRFGRLAARYLSKEANVRVFDVRTLARERLGHHVSATTLAEAASCPVVILAVPVSALRSALRAIRPHVRSRSLVIDVGAVKELPARWMQQELPKHVSLLGTHPLFGPDSAGRSLRGRWIVLCPVRIPRRRLAAIARHLHRKGIRTVVMSVRDHDRMAAETILLTQYVGRLVIQARLRRWPPVTPAYGGLLRLIEIAGRDSRELFYDMVMHSREGRRVARVLGRSALALSSRLEEPKRSSPKKGDR